MKTNEELLNENFNDANLAEVRAALKSEAPLGLARTEGKAYVMAVQHSGSDEVKITAKSRKICVEALLR